MDSAFFTNNRKRLAESLNGGVAVLTAYTKMQGAADAAASFTQEPNFWWLSGINSADWQLIIDGRSGKSWLTAPKVSDSHQLFDGSLSPEQALDRSGTDGVLQPDEATEKLRSFARQHAVVYTIGDPSYARYADFVLNPAPRKLWDVLARTFSAVQDCRKELARLRAVKQPAELDAITKATTLTAKAFERVKGGMAGYRYEFQIEAELIHHFRMQGANHAFAPIVAAGKNACTLHYDENTATLAKRQFVLIDAGARLDGYPSDITRTYAIGEPTKRQAAVHKAVQSAEQHILSLLRPDLKLEEYVRSVDSIMKDTLLSLGLMRSLDDNERYRRYFPHAISHGVGADVHDSFGGWTYLRPSMVLTVEPGIYIPEEGIGVRIEDIIAITKDGHSNLSACLSTDA